MPTSSGPPLSGRQLRKTARAAIRALKNNGFHCCLFGSVACAIYGMSNREPNDVDIIVLSDNDPEYIKDTIKSYDRNFFLLPSSNPENTYQILWHALPGERACKVDILVPGLLSIPEIPVECIVYEAPFPDIPVAPFLVVLLLKLRGWTDHRVHSMRYMREKVSVDEEDIDELLELAVEEYGVHLRAVEWIPEWFLDEARERVGEYIKEWPDSMDGWSNIGFTVI